MRLCVETFNAARDGVKNAAAAFVRLCVETPHHQSAITVKKKQPPSCGCVLKLIETYDQEIKDLQPPSCGCVLKPYAQTLHLVLH